MKKERKQWIINFGWKLLTALIAALSAAMGVKAAI